MKGWRTIAFNGAIAAGAALLPYAAGVDWTQVVSPTWAGIIVGGVNIALRYVTNTPVGSKA